ncbi:MAG: retropepsin-like aspartic protease [Bacteroidota bacterium]|nr:retropepsin-like aspartic protease [Bacteroidota bacterium]
MPEKTKRNIFIIAWTIISLSTLGRIAEGGNGYDKAEFISVCKKAAKDSADGVLIKKVDIDKFCNCAYEKMKDRKDIDLLKMKDRSSPVFNEVIMACFSETRLKDTPVSESEIIGLKLSATIDLINGPQGNRVKTYLSGKPYYFMLDNGASDVVINKKIANQLKSEKILVYNTPAETQEYELANGQSIVCKIAVIKELHIGKYIVTNIRVAVQQNNDTDLLLGKSFLEKFYSWSLINYNHALVLKK